jgi:ubiquinone biosynthesis protein UbiJ
MFALASVTALNHLLAQNIWALDRLVRFSGKTVQFNVAPFTLAYTILPDGMLTRAAADTSPDARCTIPPSLLPRLAMQDELAHAEIQGEGDSTLLTEIFFLSRNLRWDAAEDLSRYTGDIAAERLVQLVHGKQQHIRETAVNLAQAAAEYWTEESPLIAKPQQISAFMQQVDTLRDDLARLEQRVSRLLTQ